MYRIGMALVGWIALTFTAASTAGEPGVPIPAPAHPFIPSVGPEVRSFLGSSPDPKSTEKIAEVKISPNTSMPRLGPPQEPHSPSLVDAAIESSLYVHPRCGGRQHALDERGIWERGRDNAHDLFSRVFDDYRQFYLTRDLAHVALALAVAASIANTHADQGLRDWYQRRAGQGQHRSLDETARFFKRFGDHQYFVPGYLVLAVGDTLFPEVPWLNTVSTFGRRSLRALAVGAPSVGVLQVGLGASRPFTEDSHWRPFHSSHGVSGHAFVGAVPFLTAATMTDSYVLKAIFITGSLGTAWSRIHHDDHYFSQALLGWSIAYLSVHAVNQTDSRWQVVPVDIPNGVGMGVMLRY